MQKSFSSIKNFILDLFFPKFCINCGKEGSYLCQDCLALIDISAEQFCPFCESPRIVLDGKTCKYCRRHKKLTGLFSATSYKEPLVKKMLQLFKYEPFCKELSQPLSSLIINHFKILSKRPVVDFIIPVPLHKKKLKERGFNQAEEIALELSKFLEIPMLDNILIKIKQTYSQVELKKEEREKNIKGAFKCRKPELIKGKRILLVDDIFTTGSTLEECAKILKEAGARQVWGAVVARG